MGGDGRAAGEEQGAEGRGRGHEEGARLRVLQVAELLLIKEGQFRGVELQPLLAAELFKQYCWAGTLLRQGVVHASSIRAARMESRSFSWAQHGRPSAPPPKK